MPILEAGSRMAVGRGCHPTPGQGHRRLHLLIFSFSEEVVLQLAVEDEQGLTTGRGEEGLSRQGVRRQFTAQTGDGGLGQSVSRGSGTHGACLGMP